MKDCIINNTFLKSFLTIVKCLYLFIFAIKIVESVIFFIATKPVVVPMLAKMLYCNLITCGFLSLILLIIYCLISIFSKKTARLVSLFFCIAFIMFELCCVIYTQYTGLMLGAELIMRPLWETLFTIQSTMNFKLVMLVMILIGGIVATFIWLDRKKTGKKMTFTLFILMIVSVPSFFIVNYNPAESVNSKTWYCLMSCMNGSKSNYKYDSQIIKQYKSLFPERQVVDNQYPLEREDNIPNVLSPYFVKKDIKPEVVIIVVESLGTEWFGGFEDKTCYAPFLDSLAQKGLLWYNCLSSTQRSFGAIPCITGSVPNGINGFQFGVMPKHNSLISILNNNDYQTNAFYAGDYNFDNVSDYLLAQKMDYLCPLNEMCKNDKSIDKDFSYWGYNDAPLFQKSLNIIKKQNDKHPHLNLFITISTHGDLSFKNKNCQDYYVKKAENIITTYPKEIQEVENKSINQISIMLYTDDAIKKFINDYKQLDSYNNTIFIITGDHSGNYKSKNILSGYHVPLIIWSPLLTHNQTFASLVSHNEITPSLLALLKGNFNVNTPETVHWISDGLDTSVVFRSTMKNYLLRYGREVNEIIFDNYLYSKDGGNEFLYEILNNLDLKQVDNKELKADLKQKLATMTYIDKYVYTNNRLTKHPLIQEKTQRLNYMILPDSVSCITPEQKPSLVGVSKTTIINNLKIQNDNFSSIKLLLKADATYTEFVWQEQFIKIAINCEGKNISTPILFSENTSKFFVDKEMKPKKNNKIELSKEFFVKDEGDLNISVFLVSPEKDDLWKANHSLLLKNIEIEIVGTCSDTIDKGFEYPESKIWKHGVYSKHDAAKYENVFDGLEVDLIYSSAKDDIFIGRVESDADKNALFTDWLSMLKNPRKMSLWIDFKNLSTDNDSAALIRLNDIVGKYNIKDKVMVESQDVKALLKAKKEGFYVILWVDNLHYWRHHTTEDSISICKTIRHKINILQPDAISCEFTMYPLLCDTFPEQNIHFWDTPKDYTEENVKFTQKLCREKSVKVVLVDYPNDIDY